MPPEASSSPLVAVDIGNTRWKFGLFQRPFAVAGILPGPVATLSLVSDEIHRLEPWLAQHSLDQEPEWRISSVNRTGQARLHDWLRQSGRDGRSRMLTAADMPIKVALERPEGVGLDRLADAVAANCLRDANRGAIVVDLGSAITVNLIRPTGEFAGGAILPGLGLAAVALHEMTDQLPLVDVHHFQQPPAALGTATIPAMQSGLYWGAVGAIRELVAQLSRELDESPDLFLTGGYADSVTGQLGERARHVPHLTLAGIALAT
jgi:type III pantothenate kinase